MKNILLILPYGGVGGMERLALNFYNFYKSKGYHVTALKFFSLESDIINFNEDELALSKKDLFEFTTVERLKFYFLAPIKIRRIIKKYNITHSISFGDLTNVFSALSFTNEKKIGSIHALKSVELSSNSIFSKITKFSYKTTYKSFDKLVCISHAIKKDLIENCGYKFQNNLEVIYNPHDMEHIKLKALEPIENDIEVEIFKKDVILFLGRMSIQKSPWHLIKAFSLLKERNNTNLVFIGDGDFDVTEYVNLLVKKYHLENNVFFLGRKTNPYKYLAKAKVLALSSHYEGTPNVIVEAIALNIPVVSSNCTHGIAELMSINIDIKESKENITVDGGIITPNLYKGSMGVPNAKSDITEEELLFSKALIEVLQNKEWESLVTQNSTLLTEKFNINFVCDIYLQ
ncbi:glycosyltransferase [Mariniflexile litorale]|uniref:Glycosyltransferase n=1 Tax=Mariniflexile litorale TaxID=3045158 RepID=A0AAU7EFZ3_9FLAO|nr:glycosyltransferase [Mariniflexile sp. KMM 9835]MDQ8211509.1 glycosyltransferase [Mariniflexile sp. KMM 9835]